MDILNFFVKDTPIDGFIYIYIYIYIFFFFFFIYGLWSLLLKDHGSIWLYNISITHIRPLTPL